jgi:predicted transcriptional regulator
MGEAQGRRQGNRKKAPISLRAEVVVVRDPELHRRQVRAIRSFLLALATRVGEVATSDTDVVAETARGDGLEGLIGPVEAAVVRVVWGTTVPVSVREVLRELNGGRSRPLGYTTIQTVLTRLTRKQMLARSRHGRVDLYRAVAPDAASIAVTRLLAQFGETAIRPFLEQVSREPELRPVLHAALSLIR